MKSPCSQSMQFVTPSPEVTIYNHMQIEEIHISADALENKLRDFEQDIKESSKRLLVDCFIEVILIIVTFSTTTFASAMSLSAEVWSVVYSIVSIMVIMRVVCLFLNKSPWVRKEILKKSKLITRKEFINNLKDENKKVNGIQKS